MDRLKPAHLDPTDSSSLANPNCSPTQHPSNASARPPINNPDTQATTPMPLASVSLSKQTRSSRTIRMPLRFTGVSRKTQHQIRRSKRPSRRGVLWRPRHWNHLENKRVPLIRAHMHQQPQNVLESVCEGARARFPANQYLESTLWLTNRIAAATSVYCPVRCA